MATQYGLTAQGFVLKQQDVIIGEVNALIQGLFGPNSNLSANAVFGQLVGIFSEREALLWQLTEALNSNFSPAGAEGTAVDNILALNNLRRLPATPTKTAPTSTAGVPGLKFLGTPGTVIPKGSIISVQGNASLQFTTDANVTIAAAVNAVQVLSAYIGAPTAGTFVIFVQDAAGNLVSTGAIPYSTQDALTTVTLATAPVSLSDFKIVLSQCGVSQTTGNIAVPGGGFPTAMTVQNAITALTGYSGVTVVETNPGPSAVFTINWGTITQPLVTITGNTTGVVITPVDSIQAALNNIFDSAASNYPFTDVSVAGTWGVFPTGYTITFGALTPLGSNPSSGAQPQLALQVGSNSLTNASGAVNLNAVTTVIGSIPLGTGSATCTVNGPNFVGANFLNVIGSSISGWDSVTNPLDCISGTNVETDTEAMVRRATLLAINANGPLQAIIEKVSQVPGVIQCFGSQNLSLAAQQNIAFNAVPSAGSFTLTLANLIQTQTTGAIAWNALASGQQITFSAVPTSGTWSITLGGYTVSGIQFNALAITIQAALRATVVGYSNCTVTGNFASGFIISNGTNPLLLLSVAYGSLVGATATAVDSVQAKINALSGYEPVLVNGSFASGSFVVSFNGSNGGQPQALFTASNGLTGPSMITVTYGLPGKSVQLIVNDNNGDATNLSIATAIFGSKPAGIMTYGSTSVNVSDNFGNTYAINFARPTQVPIYVVINLVTDLSTSQNPKFQPGSVTTIVDDIVEVGTLFGAGGTVIGFGSGGLVGAFNSVPGIVSYTISFGIAPAPTSNANIPFPITETPQFETFLVQVNYQ